MWSNENLLKVERALPADLWARMRGHIDSKCKRDTASHWRTVRVALLLAADSGLRREELAGARRERMSPTTYGDGDDVVWQLSIIGKRNKERTVPVSPATIEALAAHWRDRGEDFESATAGPLLAPIFVPSTGRAERKHAEGKPLGYHANGINILVEWVRKRIIKEMRDLTTDEMKLLVGTSTHSFRHTFGTHAAAEDVPLDVVQKILGHASLQTTSIYVQAEKQRMLREAAQFYRRQKTTLRGTIKEWRAVRSFHIDAARPQLQSRRRVVSLMNAADGIRSLRCAFRRRVSGLFSSQIVV